MEEQDSPGSQAGKTVPVKESVQTEATHEYLNGLTISQIKQEPEEGLDLLCEIQKREAPCLDGRNSPSSQSSPENDTRPPFSGKADLHHRSFRGKAASKTLPGMGCVEVPKSYEGLDSPVEVKEELVEDDKLSVALRCQRFRQFRFEEAEGPQKVFGQLWDLCCQWLKPECHSKEQILELVILEQFLMILPLEMQNWVREQCPETGSQALALAEDFLWRLPQGEEQREDLEDLPDEPSNSELDPLDIVKVEVPMDGDRSSDAQQYFLGEVTDLPKGMYSSRRMKAISDSPPKSQKVPLKEKPHKCQYCGKLSDCHAHLIIHERTHTGEKPHKCSLCGKTFSDKTRHLIHERTHTGEKPYKCSECGKNFGTRCNLLRHRRVHTGEKPYRCSDCGQSFWYRPQLVNHEGTHKGEKPYKCADGGETFSQTQQLVIHKWTHTGEWPHMCTICSKSFNQKSDLITHTRTHTGEKPKILRYLLTLHTGTGMSKQKRQAYKISFKLEVVKYAEEHGNRAAEKHFGPPPTEKMIREWRKQVDQLQKVKDKSKHNFRGLAAKWPQLEVDMKDWITRHRNNGFAVSTKMVIYEAKRIAVEKGIQDFTGSSSWCYRFMRRYGLGMRTKNRIGQKMPQEYESRILSFHKFVTDARKKNHFEIGQIGNMDEVPLTFDVPSNKTVDLKGAKSRTMNTSGHEKTHCTVVLSCCADGTKLPPMLIFKRKTFPKEVIPKGVVVHVHEKGRMDEHGMRVWVEKVWSKRPGGLLKKPALLVLDQFRAHISETAKKSFKEMKTQLAVIPGGLTSQLQPLHVSINKPFKAYMREEWNKWMAAGNHDLTPTGRMKRPTVTQVCEWVKTSWHSVKDNTVERAFKKCGISNALDGTEDSIICEDSEENDISDGEELSFINSDTKDEEFLGFPEN